LFFLFLRIKDHHFNKKLIKKNREICIMYDKNKRYFAKYINLIELEKKK